MGMAASREKMQGAKPWEHEHSGGSGKLLNDQSVQGVEVGLYTQTILSKWPMVLLKKHKYWLTILRLKLLDLRRPFMR